MFSHPQFKFKITFMVTFIGPAQMYITDNQATNVVGGMGIVFSAIELGNLNWIWNFKLEPSVVIATDQ